MEGVEAEGVDKVQGLRVSVRIVGGNAENYMIYCSGGPGQVFHMVVAEVG